MSKMAGGKKNRSILDLTWQDLQDWAGRKIVSRGKSYRNAIDDLRQTSDGWLVAWVRGSRQYATLAGIDAEGKLVSECTCPYAWGPCKHAVAVLLSYLDAVKKETPVAEAPADDKRLKRLLREEDDDLFEDEEGDWIEEDEDWIDETDAVLENKQGKRKRSGALKEYLNKLSKKELIEIVSNLAKEHPVVEKAISDRAQLAEGRVERMVSELRGEIEELSSHVPWTNNWTGKGYVPNYTHVRERMQALLDAGHADAVVSLGEELLEQGMRQIEMAHDEGETGDEIGACLGVALRALPLSSMPPVEQVLWIIGVFLEDNYGILDEHGAVLDNKAYTKKVWGQTADAMEKRLAEMPDPNETGEGDSFFRSYHRSQVMHWTIYALENAARKQEIIPLLEREAPVTSCYETLVDRLIAARRRDEARRWAKEGFEKTVDKLPGIAWNLETKLRDLAEREKNWPLAASYRALEFFNYPGVTSFSALGKAAEKAGAWTDARAAVLQYLETGFRADLARQTSRKETSEKVGRSNRTGKSQVTAPGAKTRPMPWPLPPTDLHLFLPRHEINPLRFPDINALIDIAIHENRLDDAIRWHEAAEKRGGHWGYSNREKVAEAVQKTHPNVALKLWKELAEGLIAQVKPSAYEAAGQYLRKMESVYRREKRLPDWKAYLTELRAKNKRRPRMIEVLDDLEGQQKPKRILESN